MGDYEVLLERITNIQSDVAEIKQTLKNEYVCKNEFTPVRNIVYGLVGIIMTSVIIALLTVIVQ